MDKLEGETEICAKLHHKIQVLTHQQSSITCGYSTSWECLSMCHSSEAQTHDAMAKVMGWISRAQGSLAFDGRVESEL